MHGNARHRLAILEALYQALEANPKGGWASERELSRLFGDTAFAVAVLRELGHIQANGPRYRITGPGILAYEAACEAE